MLMATLTDAVHSIRSRMVRPALLARAAAPSRGLPNSSVRRTLASRPRPPIRSEAASAVATAIAEAEANLTLRDHLIRIGLWSIISLNVGAYFGQGDEGAQVLLHLDEFAERILAADTKRSVLTEALERVSRGAASNDTLKLRLLAQPFLFDRLLALCTDARVGGPARNHAVKVLEAITGSPEAQREIVASGRHTSYLELMQHEGTSLYARKALAAAVCNLAELPDHAMTMGRVGTVSALMAEQEADARLRRKRVEVGAARLACALHALGADALAPLPSAERVLIERLAADEAAAAAALGPLHRMRATLLESGLLLYLHTAAGGAAWGLFESVRAGQGRAALVQNVARTALVTCFVPILMVGGVVTGYNRINKRTDSINEKFALYFAGCVALYPASRFFAWVEAFAPLWLGGHIVGFGSFFAWTLYTESDLLKSDSVLLKAQQQGQ